MLRYIDVWDVVGSGSTGAEAMSQRKTLFPLCHPCSRRSYIGVATPLTPLIRNNPSVGLPKEMTDRYHMR